MGFVKDAKGRRSLAFVGGVLCSAVVLCLSLGMAQAQQLEIDMDRNTPGIQTEYNMNPAGELVVGEVLLTGIGPEDTVGPGYGIAVNVAGLTFNPDGSAVREGDATGGGANIFLSPTGDQFFLSYVKTGTDPGPADGSFSLVEFDLQFGDCNQGATTTFSFVPSSQGGGQIGVGLNGTTVGVVDGSNPLPAVGGALICGGTTPITPPPTDTPFPPCEDAGYFVLDSFGGRHRVGNATYITGSLYFGNDVARDMERTISTPAVAGPMPELAVLDAFGAVQFVQFPDQVPSQGFYFPDGTPCGYAVDVEIANSNDGFWVLTEQGGIYRAGTALPGGANAGDPLGNAAGNLCAVLGIPFVCPGTIGGPERDPGLPCPDDMANIRAVGFVVVQSGDPSAPTGYVILDSQGGHYIFDADGNVLDDDLDGSILNGPGGATETVYPFWAGLDIGRDIELHPDGGPLAGMVIYDGWGGIHPVPVDVTLNSKVSYLRNDGGPTQTTVGLPYIVGGFDDPNTVEDESPSFDYSSIFTDIEFCATGQEGVYVLDRFGGVFAFGATRAAPNDVQPMFTGGPYFYPNLYAEDLEPETVFLPDPQ